MTKCEICHDHEAEYAMQYLDEHENEGQPEFYLLGSHIRGFPVTKACIDCYWDLTQISKRKK